MRWDCLGCPRPRVCNNSRVARPARKRKTHKQAPGWLWMLSGLSIGLIVALVVYVRGGGLPAPDLPSVLAVPQSGPAAAVALEPASAPEQAEPAEATFDFYEMLPRFEVVIPEVESQARADTTPAAVEAPGAYVLQAGSFRQLADADRRQASLALLGIESRIQRVTIDDDVYHRVRVGPMNNLEQLNRARATLRDNRIETLLIKLP